MGQFVAFSQSKQKDEGFHFLNVSGILFRSFSGRERWKSVFLVFRGSIQKSSMHKH